MTIFQFILILILSIIFLNLTFPDNSNAVPKDEMLKSGQIRRKISYMSLIVGLIIFVLVLIFL